MPIGLTRDAGWEIGVSRTLPHPLPVVWDYLSGPAGLSRWLGAGAVLTPERGSAYRTDAGVTGEVRGYRVEDRIRVTHGSTTVQVAVRPSADGARTTVRFHQEHLTSAEEREHQRDHWRRVLDGVAADLDGATL